MVKFDDQESIESGFPKPRKNVSNATVCAVCGRTMRQLLFETKLHEPTPSWSNWTARLALEIMPQCGDFRKWGYPKLAGWFIMENP